MPVEVVALLGAMAAAGLGLWVLRTRREARDLEELSSRALGSVSDLAARWAGEDQAG
ncbi:MAG TPA: hypothetical protein VFP54_06150 [Acidimicrobiales bacterium]|nr:hypothetical protein [Acidimicrobiales bacterium]